MILTGLGLIGNHRTALVAFETVAVVLEFERMISLLCGEEDSNVSLRLRPIPFVRSHTIAQALRCVGSDAVTLLQMIHHHKANVESRAALETVEEALVQMLAKDVIQLVLEFEWDTFAAAGAAHLLRGRSLRKPSLLQAHDLLSNAFRVVNKVFHIHAHPFMSVGQMNFHGQL